MEEIRYPNLYIPGFPKCGTTSIAYWLAQHPQVFMPKIKETHFFSKDIGILNFSLQDYLNLYKKAKNYKYLLDASTSYIYSEVAIKEIEKATNGKAKYIVMLRNPVDMVYSLYFQNIYEGFEKALNFEEAWNLSDIRWQGKDPYKSPNPKAMAYKYIGKLGSHTENFLNLVNKERILFILFEELKEPQILWNKILSFLNLPFIDIKYNHYNASKKIKFPIINRLIYKLYWVKHNKLKIKQNWGLAEKFKNFISKKEKYPPMPEEIRKLLLDYYKPEIEKLETLLRMDLSRWKK